MSTGTQTGSQKTVVELTFEADESGGFPGATGGTIHVAAGSDIRFTFTGRAGSIPASLSIDIQGSSVVQKEVVTVSQMVNGKMMWATGEIDGILSTTQAGNSTVEVKLLDDKDQPTQVMAFTVAVS